MRRGEVWTVSGSTDYTGKPRPAVIIQDNRFDGTASITLCVFTTDDTEAPFFRLPIDPTGANGLRQRSSIMVDKITTVSKSKLGRHIGQLDDRQMVELNRAVMLFLGLA